MSRTGIVRLGPRATVGLLNSRVAKRTLYGDDIRMLAHKPTPVVLDHDDDQEVGEVLELFTFDDWVPAGVPDARWLAARIRLHDDAPAWIKKGTGASISFWPGYVNNDFFGWQRVASAVLKEVTLCSSATSPVEPLAQVLTLSESQPAGQLIEHGLGARAAKRAPILRRNTGTILGIR